MTALETTRVTQADEELGLRLWRVHPDEIFASGMTRPQWYAHQIARHRQAAEAAGRAREAEPLHQEVTAASKALRDAGFSGDSYHTARMMLRAALLARHKAEGGEG